VLHLGFGGPHVSTESVSLNYSKDFCFSFDLVINISLSPKLFATSVDIDYFTAFLKTAPNFGLEHKSLVTAK